MTLFIACVLLWHVHAPVEWYVAATLLWAFRTAVYVVNHE